MNTAPGLWPSHHDLPTHTRQAMITLLNRQLADLIDVGLQAKQAHWNVKGPQFAALHALFDEAAEKIAEATDEVAERAVELGGLAQGTLATVVRDSRLSTYPPAALAGAEHVAALTAALAHVAATTRAAIDTAAAAGDASTADVFTEASRTVDKLLWQVEAHGVGA